MTDMLDSMAVTVTDEVTLLRERLDEANAYIDNVEHQRDEALNRLDRFIQLDKDNHRLIDMMTKASNRKGEELKRAKEKHNQQLAQQAQRSEKREAISAIFGFIAGLVSTALIVTIVYMPRW